MNSRHFKILAAFAIGAGLTGVCAAAESNPWSIAVYAGDAVSGSGKFRSPQAASIANLGTLDPKLAGTSGTLALDRLGYHEAYHNRFSAALEVGYTVNDNLQAFGRFSYDARQGRERDIGSLSSSAFASPQRVIAHFGNSDSRGLEVGARYLWLASEQWRPYVALSVGSTRTDDMNASLNVTNTAISVAQVRFAKAGNTFSQSFETGVEYNPSKQFGVRFSVRANHVGTPPSDRDPRLASLGFNAGNDAGNRVDYPVSLAGVYRFE